MSKEDLTATLIEWESEDPNPLSISWETATEVASDTAALRPTRDFSFSAAAGTSAFFSLSAHNAFDLRVSKVAKRLPPRTADPHQHLHNGTQVLGARRDCEVYRCTPCVGQGESVGRLAGELLKVPRRTRSRRGLAKPL